MLVSTRLDFLSNPYIAVACGSLVGLVFNYVLSDKVVFRQQREMSSES
jgi:putative flippase GtrA